MIGYKEGDKCITMKNRKITIFAVVRNSNRYVFRYTDGNENTNTYYIHHDKIDHEATAKLNTASPKSLVKDGWRGVQNNDEKVYLIPSIHLGAYRFGHSFEMKRYDDNLESKYSSDESLKELYDNEGKIRWKREEKEAFKPDPLKVYIAGPITGIENYQEAFAQRQTELEAKGYTVINPAILPEGFEHHEYMHICYSMIDVCDAISLLPGWDESKGAQLEFKHAEKKNKLIIIN